MARRENQRISHTLFGTAVILGIFLGAWLLSRRHDLPHPSPRTTETGARRGDFRSDPEIPSGAATPDDYVQSGYDRGHLASAADMAFSVRTMSESFYMSNISLIPQPKQKHLERSIKVENWDRIR